MLKLGASYFGSRIQRHVKEDMADIVRHNCNFVIHTFSETDLEYYKGTMKEIVDISHEAGLEVWVDPWAVGGVFGGETYSRFIAEQLDAREVSAKGESLPAACLNNGKFRDFMRGWADAAVDIGADVLFWDEPHFYLYPLDDMEKDMTLWACRCDVCREGFKKQFGYEMPVEINQDIRVFKEDSIAGFLKEMCDYAKGKTPQNPKPRTQNPPARHWSLMSGRAEPRTLKNALCFLPFKGELGGIMDWSKAARIESLDIIGVDPYWRPGEKDVAGYVRPFAKKIQELSVRYGKEGQIWILNFRIKKGAEKDIETAVMTAYDEGIRNLAAWSYLGTGCMSYLASEDPQKAWDMLGLTFKKLCDKV